MRPDHNIGLRNGLVDDKHYRAMGQAIWLYIWLLDRETKSDGKVLGGKPVRYEDFSTSYPSIKKRVYVRYMQALRDGGYISTIRAPRGLVVKIEKPKKWSDAPKTAHQKTNSDRTKSSYQKPSDRTKMTHLIGQKQHIQYKSNSKSNNRRSNILGAEAPSRERDQVTDTLPDIDIEGSDLLTDNGLKPKIQRRDSADINGIVAKFETTFGFKLKRIAKQRQTAHNLVRRYGADGVLSAIDAAYLVRDERYAPQISNLDDLWEKWERLESYFRRRAKDQQSKTAVITEDEE